MSKKKYGLILMVVCVFAITTVFCGCTKQLDEPVFLKELVCSSDMDADVSFITNTDYEKSVEGVEIPNMPDGMSVQFYEEEIDDSLKYDIHTVSFGVATDELAENSGLKEDFVFHEVIVKWDDGSTTTADVGTIHMTPDYQSFVLGGGNSNGSSLGEAVVEHRTKYTAKEDMRITSVTLPYAEQLSDVVTDLAVGNFAASAITENTPLELKAGEEFEISYTIDYDASKTYGQLFLEGVITGETAKGEAFTDVFRIVDSQGRRNSDWVEKQIKEAE